MEILLSKPCKMMKNSRLISLFLLLFFFSEKSFALVSFSVQNEEIPKTKILFFGFDQTEPNLRVDSAEIFERIRKNLKTTDLFELFKQSGYLEAQKDQSLSQDSLTVESIPNFEKYVKSGIGAIVVGQFNYDAVGNLEVRIRMWDVLDRRQLFGKFYTASKDNIRKASNLISNEIFKSITGESSGHFTSQIAYVSESGSASKRIKKLNIIDFDGENNRLLTDGRELVLTPVFSKRQDEIFYLRYFEDKPQIFAINLKSLRNKRIGGFRGTTFAASSHPKDPNLLLLSAIVDGNSDIYELNINANSARRLTKSSAIDTTASYSPDGKFIAFASDRDSGQKIYVMYADGSSVSRITDGAGAYSKPVWSPDGKMIAFTKIQNGQFHVGIMVPNGKGEKLLTSAYLVEGAKWSPNGRYLIYSKKKGPYGRDSVPRLFVIDVVTGFEFEVPTPAGEGASDPDWV
jgi:TolB protein